MELLNAINNNLLYQTDEYAEYTATSLCVNPYVNKQSIYVEIEVQVKTHQGLVLNRIVKFNVDDLDNSKINNETIYYKFLDKFFNEVQVTEQNLINYIDVQYKWDY